MFSTGCSVTSASGSEAEGVKDICAGFHVSGRVQGVGYRWWVCKVAERLEIRGTVRNRVDGSVEVHACGSLEAVGALEVELWRGPWAARVERLDRFESDAAGADSDFTVIG